jgi:purine catabolism regulator
VYPDVAQVLELPEVKAGLPRVRAGADRLHTAVRWVHVSEIPDVGGTLSGGELLLSTGIVATDPGTDVAGYVRSLCEAEVAGLVVELDAATSTLPDRLVGAAREHGLVLVELRRNVRFVEITEAVHGRILHAQYERLRFSQRVHDSFATLGVEAVPAGEILARASELAGVALVLEDLAHHAVAFAGQVPAGVLLRDWAARSRRTPTPSTTSIVGSEGWLVTAVGPSRRRWGRLLMPRVDPDADLDALTMVAERAAEAIAVARLVDGDSLDVAAEARANLLHKLATDLGPAGATAHDEAGLRSRLRALGMRLGPAYAVLVLALPTPATDQDGAAAENLVVAAASRVSRGQGRAALVGAVGAGRVALVFACPSTAREPATVAALAAALSREPGVPADLVVAAADPITALSALSSALRDATHIADVATAAGPLPAQHHREHDREHDREHHPVHRTADLGVPGLLWSLRRDPRLATFTERTLQPVLNHRRAADLGLLDLLRAYLAVDGNTAELARRLHLSRPAVYGRLKQLSDALGADLATPHTKLSLHLALLAHDQSRQP